MPKAKTTRTVSDEHEEFIVKKLAPWNARRSVSSGANYADPHDVTSDIHVTECKATEGKTISVKLADWIKQRNKSGLGRTPTMAFRFRDPYTKDHIDLMMIEVEEYVWLREELENLRQLT